MENSRITFSYIGILAIFGSALFFTRLLLDTGSFSLQDIGNTSVPVRLDLQELDSFTAEDLEAFAVHLRRDARWRVFKQTRTFGAGDTSPILSATLRNNRYGVWLENENVHFANGDNPDELKVEIQFGLNSIHDRYRHGLPQRMRVVNPGAQSVALSPYRPQYNFDDTRYTSELAIEREGLLIHITETARDKNRNLSARFLDYLRDVTGSIKEKGLAATELSVGSVKKSNTAECIFVHTTRAASGIAVRGYVNPQESGTLSFAARGIMSGNLKEHWHSTQELTGFSKNSAEQFYFSFWQTSVGRLAPQQYRYTLTFKPDSGGTERILAECDPENQESFTYQSVLKSGEAL